MEIRSVTSGTGGLERINAPIRHVVRVEQPGMRVVPPKTGEPAPRTHARRWDRRAVHVHARVLLFPFRPPVLEPDFHLRLRQAEAEGQIESFANAEVPIPRDKVVSGNGCALGWFLPTWLS